MLTLNQVALTGFYYGVFVSIACMSLLELQTLVKSRCVKILLIPTLTGAIAAGRMILDEGAACTDDRLLVLLGAALVASVIQLLWHTQIGKDVEGRFLFLVLGVITVLNTLPGILILIFFSDEIGITWTVNAYVNLTLLIYTFSLAVQFAGFLAVPISFGISNFIVRLSVRLVLRIKNAVLK